MPVPFTTVRFTNKTGSDVTQCDYVVGGGPTVHHSGPVAAGGAPVVQQPKPAAGGDYVDVPNFTISQLQVQGHTAVGPWIVQHATLPTIEHVEIHVENAPGGGIQARAVVQPIVASEMAVPIP